MEPAVEPRGVSNDDRVEPAVAALPFRQLGEARDVLAAFAVAACRTVAVGGSQGARRDSRKAELPVPDNTSLTWRFGFSIGGKWVLFTVVV